MSVASNGRLWFSRSWRSFQFQHRRASNSPPTPNVRTSAASVSASSNTLPRGKRATTSSPTALAGNHSMAPTGTHAQGLPNNRPRRVRHALSICVRESTQRSAEKDAGPSQEQGKPLEAPNRMRRVDQPRDLCLNGSTHFRLADRLLDNHFKNGILQVVSGTSPLPSPHVIPK